MSQPPVAVPGTLPYRKDIDGIRGIAILLVLAYHFNIPPVSGGYIGVDIFFVVSGFLIASLLATEQGVLAPMADFYRRRIKRLTPMFLVVAAVTTLVATALLLPDDFIRYLNSLRDALLFKANVFFDRETHDYFGANARELPLLHTWSLSIEWQFYLLFPVFFLIAQRRSSQRVVTGILVVITLALTAYSVAVASTTNAHYFQTAARLFELLTGACAARFAFRLPPRIATMLVAVDVAALLALAVLFTPATPFPGGNALMVCVLTALLIAGGQGNRWLSYGPLAHVGKISYSAYLWHWPLLAFMAYLQIQPTLPASLALIVGVLALSHGTHAWIEEPARRLRIRFRTAFVGLFLMPALVVVVALVPVRWNDGFPQRLGAASQHAYANLKPYLNEQQHDCHDFTGDDIETCAFGATDSRDTALLLGDSHARHYFDFVEVLARDAKIKVYGLTASECLMLPGARVLHNVDGCARDTARNFELIRTRHFRYVLLGERWIGYDAAQLDRLDDTVLTILDSGAIPVILNGFAEDGTDKKACFEQHIKLRQTDAEDCGIPVEDPYAAASKAEVARRFERLHAKYPMVKFIDPLTVQCDAGKCIADFDGTPLYDDTHHINGYASALFGRRYLQRWGNPLGH